MRQLPGEEGTGGRGVVSQGEARSEGRRETALTLSARMSAMPARSWNASHLRSISARNGRVLGAGVGARLRQASGSVR